MRFQNERTCLDHLTLLHNIEGPGLPAFIFFFFSYLNILSWHLFRLLRPHRPQFMLMTLSIIKRGAVSFLCLFPLNKQKNVLTKVQSAISVFFPLQGETGLPGANGAPGQPVNMCVLQYLNGSATGTSWLTVTHLSFNYNYTTAFIEQH